MVEVKSFGIIRFEPLKGKDALGLMMEINSCLKYLGINYWFSAGTTLGLVREEKGFIDNDTDIDVEIQVCSNEPALIKTLFETKNCPLVRTMLHDGKTMQQVFVGRNNILIDIYYYYDEGGLLVNHNEVGRLVLPKSYVQDKDVVKGLPNPKNVRQYLVDRYGEDWETPQSGKKGWDYAGKLLKRNGDGLL
jgi:hypothetical protein